MFSLPPVPSWDGLHPLIIHFPIALLLAAPLFIVVGAFMRPKSGRTMMLAAFILMLLGTISVFVALGTGEAAAELADRTPEISAQLERHENMAETVRIVFSGLTVAFGVLLLIPLVMRRELSRAVHTIVPLAFVLVYLGGAVLLVNTAHEGGRLVHEFGVKAIVAGTPTATPAQPDATTPQD